VAWGLQPIAPLTRSTLGPRLSPPHVGSLCLTQAMLYPCRGSDFGREVLNQVGQLQEQCTRLQEAAEQLWGDSKDTQVSVVLSSGATRAVVGVRSRLEAGLSSLGVSPPQSSSVCWDFADCVLLEWGMDVVSRGNSRGRAWACRDGGLLGIADTISSQKADETTLETKASQDELQSTMAQLSEMMQDLLRRMFLHGQDRHKASELMREMNSKVAVSPREDGGPPVYSLQREGKP